MAIPPATGTSYHRLVKQFLKRLLRTISAQLREFIRPFFPGFSPIRGEEGREALRLTVTDKRRHLRISVPYTKVHVTDGCLFATASIDNISLNGICLGNLPEQLYRSAEQLTVFSSDNPGIPILQIQPRWEKPGWNGKSIGATIINVSESWHFFFRQTTEQFQG